MDFIVKEKVKFVEVGEDLEEASSYPTQPPPPLPPNFNKTEIYKGICQTGHYKQMKTFLSRKTNKAL